jgi:two-component system NarL family sensor kinase
VTPKVAMALPETGARAAAAVLAVVVGLFGVTATIVVVRVGGYSDLTEVNRGASLWSPGGLLITRRAGVPGLAACDEIRSIDGQSPAWWVGHGLRNPLRRAAPATLSYTVRGTGGDTGTRPVRVVLQPVRFAGQLRENWPGCLLMVLFVVVVGYVFARRPRARAAQALLVGAGALTVAATGWVGGLTASDFAHGPGLVLWAATGIGLGLLWGATLHFALVFPDVHPLLRGRGWLVGLAYAAPFLLRAGSAALGSARAGTDWQRVQARAVPTATEQWILPLLVVAVLVAGYAAATDRTSRAQLLLVGAAISVGLAGLVGLSIVPAALLGRPLLAPELQPLLLVPVPIAIAVAVLRHQMLEIKILINRTLVWGLLTTGVVGTYVGAVSLLDLPPQTRRAVLVTSLTATAVVAVALQPARQVLQAAVNRVTYGHRHEPYRVLSELGRQIGATASPVAVLPGVVELIGRELRLPWVSIELPDCPPITWSAAPARPPTAPERRPLAHHGTVAGYLAVSPRAAGKPLPAADRRLLDDLARQLGVAAHAVQLTAALHRSRDQLVAAREEERHHIHHDLHDRLGPTLAAIALQLEIAAGRLPPEQAALKTTLTQLLTETQQAIQDVRRLVYGLRPPAVRELGLLAALREKAATFSAPADDGRVRFTVTAGELPPLPVAVEVAAYRIAVEAMTNVIRHARARRCTVRVELGDSLRLLVTDDGAGPPTPLTPGVGVSSMLARAAELGGSCQIRRGPAAGTEVEAELPLASRRREGVR